MVYMIDSQVERGIFNFFLEVLDILSHRSIDNITQSALYIVLDEKPYAKSCGRSPHGERGLKHFY